MKRLYLLVIILTVLATVMGGIALSVLYNTAYEVKRLDLIQMAKSQARLIESVARFDQQHSENDHPEGASAATLAQVREAIGNYKGFGDTGEFVLGTRNGNQIEFLLQHRHLPETEPKPIPLASDLAEPMRRALAGQSGTVVGYDYRGETVLAAHEPISVLDLGMVAKMDMDEIRAPFITATYTIVIVGIIAIAIGAFLFFSVSNPVFRQLEESERRQRQTLETVLDGIITIDINGIIQSVNPAAEITFGYRADDLIGQNVSMLMPEPYASNHDSYIEAYKRSGNAKIIGIGRDVVGLRKDGSEFPMSLAISEMTIDGEVMFIGATRDITDRKQAEEEIREKTELVQLLLSIATKANEASTMEDALAFCLKAVCTFKGWPIGHAFVRSDSDRELLVSSGIWHLEEPEKSATLKSVTDGISFRSGEGLPGRVLATDKPIWIPLIHEDNNFPRQHLVADIGVKSGFAIPIRQGKEIVAVMEFFSFEAESSDEGFLETLTHVASELGQVIERTVREKELRASVLETEKANQAKSEFLSSMSHELRTPLNAVLGFAQLLELNPNTPLTDQQKDAVSHIKEGGEHLLELITQVLDLSKIETGNLTLSLEPVDAIDTARNSLATIRRLAEPLNISVVDKTVGKDLPYIHVDNTRFRQVLLNLLSNAVKYNRENGSVELDAAATSDNMVRISIADTGHGIAPAMQDKVFEAFNRLGREALEIEGTGIGLTISKELVELMSGRIGFETEPGKGSIFWIELPQSEDFIKTKIDATPRIEALPSQSPCQPATQMHRVLYVEDNPTNIELMESIFENLPSVKLEVERNAESGIEAARQTPPDLILMDIQLPGMNGIEAAQELRRFDETRELPVVAISAAAMKADVERASGAGFHSYLTKPINVVEILNLVQGILED